MHKFLKFKKLFSKITFLKCIFSIFVIINYLFCDKCNAQNSTTCELFALDAPKPQANSFFAASGVSVGKRFAIVGGSEDPYSSLSGRAYIYEFTGGIWVYRQTLSEPYTEHASYGASTYINDTTALVSAYGYKGKDNNTLGAVFVYTLNKDTWVKTGFIPNYNPQISSFGWRIAKSGTDLVVGGLGYGTDARQNTVAVYRQPVDPISDWKLIATFHPPTGFDVYNYGYSVDIQGNDLVVGALSTAELGTPGAFFYHRNNLNRWEFDQAEVYPKYSRAGISVALFGKYAVIGSDSNLGTRIYEKTANGWKLLQTLFSPDRNTGGRYGFSVALNAKALLISDPFMNGGVVYRYEQRGSTSWQLAKRYTAPDPKSLEYFGGWVEVDESSNNLIIGAPRRPSGGVKEAGQAFVLWNPAITPAGPFCKDAASVKLHSSTAGGTWAGKGIIEAKLGIFAPVKAGIGTHAISYNLQVGDCSIRDTILVQVKENLRINNSKIPVLNCAKDTTFTLNANVVGGQWSGHGIVNSTLGTFNPRLAGPGRHILTYQSPNTETCTPYDTISVIVQEIKTQIKTQPTRLSCNRDTSLFLQALPVGGVWEGKGISDSKQGKFNSSIAGPGRHILTYTFAPSGACSAKDTISIVVEPSKPLILTRPPSLCRLDTLLRFSASPAGGSWQGKGVTDSKLGIFNPSLAGPGSHKVYYKLGDEICMTKDSLVIVIKKLDRPIFTNPGPIFLRCGQSSTLLSINTVDPVVNKIKWQYSSSDNNSWHSLPTNNGQLTYIATMEGWYRVLIESNDCSALSDAVNIVIEPLQKVFIPNIFTPNRDGINDVFELKLQYPRSSHLQIFNRWGRELFHTDTYGDFWTGSGAPEGVYYYLWRYTTECDTDEHIVKGPVTISR